MTTIFDTTETFVDLKKTHLIIPILPLSPVDFGELCTEEGVTHSKHERPGAEQRLGAKDLCGFRLQPTDWNICDEEWSQGHLLLACGHHSREMASRYTSQNKAWVASHGPTLAVHDFNWHMNAMVCLFHVAKEGSGAGTTT